MPDRPKLTTEAGIPVTDNQHSQRAGADGPSLLQDAHLVEKLARFNRERIPERIVHAVGTGAYGVLECTSNEVSKWTKMSPFSGVGKKTEMFGRFSTVAGSKGAADTARDPRGFALKFYTEDGNWDLVGNNTPIFFIRDGIKFPDFIHSQKPDPHTNKQEPNNVWDFFAHSPEATHQFTFLFGDRGIPSSFRHMDGFSSHTYGWVNSAGERLWVKFHFKTDQGIDCLTGEEAARIGGENPTHIHDDLYHAIEQGEFPSWTLKVQVMPVAEAAGYRFNPIDLTKVWPHADYPLIPIAKLTLNRVPENFFAEVEQAAFSPGNFIPGIGPSPDPMLQARIFAYGDAHRYRLGVNHTQLPVNAPHAVAGGAQNYGRDGAMRFDDNGKRLPNYEPNSLNGPAETGQPYDFADPVSGVNGPQALPLHRDDNDFVQAGALYRVMTPPERDRLITSIAGSLAQVTIPGVIEKSIGHFRNADAEYGQRLEDAVAAIREAAGATV